MRREQLARLFVDRLFAVGADFERRRVAVQHRHDQTRLIRQCGFEVPGLLALLAVTFEIGDQDPEQHSARRQPTLRVQRLVTRLAV